MDYSVLPQKWQERFEFFDKHGGPATPEYKAALKELDFKQKIKISMNFISFFFGWIYFFVLGLWRKNIVILGSSLASGFVLGVLSWFLPFGLVEVLLRVVQLAIVLFYACTVNYAYYLHVVKGSTSWNPLEGILKPYSPDANSSSQIVS